MPSLSRMGSLGPLGVDFPMPPCPVLPPRAHSQSAWQSAFNRPDSVDELLAAELATGWIEEDPGGDEELRSRVVKLTAVGKLGVVISDHRPPRARWLTVPFPA